MAGGLSERLGIDALVLRLAFVALAFAAGAGVILYLLLWLASGDRTEPADHVLPRTSSALMQVASVGSVVLGMLLLLRDVGLWFGDAIAWPVALAALGSAVLWSRSDESGRARFSRLAARIPRGPLETLGTGPVSRARIAAGGLLIVAGVATILATNVSLDAIRSAATAVIATGAGIGLILGPWIWQLARQLSDERRARIRSEERAEVAAHLHDSVLQTLALIQRSSNPEEMVTLARGQERELRSWLYGRARATSDGTGSLSAAIEGLAGRIEQRHRIAVQTVVVGDCPVDERVRGLLDATGEALQNAAMHSGASVVSVYAEVTPESVGVYVRDEGKGFDAGTAPEGHRGIADSIVGRLERHGGAATLQTEPTQGTEWHLRMPRRTP